MKFKPIHTAYGLTAMNNLPLDKITHTTARPTASTLWGLLPVAQPCSVSIAALSVLVNPWANFWR